MATLNGMETRWLERGEADPARTILALHSLGLDASAFGALHRRLGAGWRIVSFDQRGHGVAAANIPASFAQMVDDACVAARECGATHLLGHSMGGAIAAQAAAQLAGHMSSLSIVASPAMGGQIFAERGDTALAGPWADAVSGTLSRWFGPTPSDAVWEQIAYASGTLEMMRPESFAGAWRALAQFEGYPGIAADLPTTLLCSGTEDLSTPPAAMAPIEQALTSAARPCRTCWITGAGHMLPLTHPDALAQALEAHWSGAVSQKDHDHAF